MKLPTKIFLVLLRLAIGWHLFFEGLEKIQSVNLGPTETNRPWTSEPYLREASGPLGDYFRRQIGDPDDEALARLTVLPLGDKQDPARTMLHTRFPPALAQDWQAYFDHFVKYYELDKKGTPEEEAQRRRQRDLAEAKLIQCEDNTTYWLLSGTKKVKKSFPSGTVEVEETTAQRIADYRVLLEKLRDMEKKDLPAFGHDVLKDRLRTAKADVARRRNELVQELNEQTAEMKKALRDVLTDEQKKAAMPDPPVVRPVERVDWLTQWGLTVIGACLLLGLCTRPACLGGAAFLVLFYLTMPPFPWVPENIRAEGHYLFVNKNLIEMLALLTLATTRSGRWAGLDGLLQFLSPWRWRARPPAELSSGTEDLDTNPKR
jgi:uncharacterized membrane protein YphA (DoxX/SURF4 family)